MDAEFLIQWNITDHCEFDCNHCYLQKHNGSLSFEKTKHILNNILELSNQVKQLKINLTGGNLFFFKHIHHVFQELSKSETIKLAILGNPIQSTNRILIDFGNRIQYYQLSYDGKTLGQKQLRGINNLNSIHTSLRILKNASIKTNLMFTLYRENVNDFYELLESELFYEFDNFTFSRMVPYKYISSGSILSPKEYKYFLSEVFNKLEKKRITNFYFKDPLWRLFFFENNLYAPDEKVCTGCGIGLGQISIMPNADALLCSRLEYKIGNLQKDSLEKVIKKANSYHPRNIRGQYYDCSKCELFFSCRGCAAISQKITGNPFLKDPQCWI